jgi:hypothetical protein
MAERKIRVVVAKPGFSSEGASTAPSETSPRIARATPALEKAPTHG